MQIERDTVLAGRYRIERRLGHGGMGSVWRAEDIRLHRPVAVKLAATSPTSGTSGPGQARRRLRREAAALAAISEPRIARVYDLVEADEDVCLVMELVDGESLAARLARPPRLTAAEALQITAQCAQALQAAHRIGIVHRDVKPSNIMLGPDGVKVVDFGIAAHIGPSRADTTATMSRHIVGTAAYLAPERALGAPAGGAADFYSLGVVLYQMLAGQLPFRADESLAMLYAHTRTAPEPLPADVPARAATLCVRMLSKKPEQRPTSVREINAARDAVVNGESTAAFSAFASASVGLRSRTLARVPRRRLNSAGERAAAARRGPATALAVLSSIAAVLAAASAWMLLDQPSPAGAATPAPTPPSSSASVSAVVMPPSSSRATPQATSHSAVGVSDRSSAKPPPKHSDGGKHGKHGGDGGGGGDG